jgi:hypothetical protein
LKAGHIGDATTRNQSDASAGFGIGLRRGTRLLRIGDFARAGVAFVCRGHTATRGVVCLGFRGSGRSYIGHQDAQGGNVRRFVHLRFHSALHGLKCLVSASRPQSACVVCR